MEHCDVLQPWAVWAIAQAKKPSKISADGKQVSCSKFPTCRSRKTKRKVTKFPSLKPAEKGGKKNNREREGGRKNG
jgi:hypothetical protein